MSDRICVKTIDEQQDRLWKLATDIWANPEMGWHEEKAAKWTAEYLEQEGFEVELGAYNMPTAIRAVWGHGHPVVGFCAEYDCLPGLSQKAVSHQEPVVCGGIGHGCGHNMLGVGCLGACVGLKAELEATGKEGTIIFYGCPAEEQLIGKGLMAKNGAFTECDFTVAWHPGAKNRDFVGINTGVEGAIFHFKGRTAHAAGNPHLGRSALDAAQLMNMGVEFLREHVTSDVRMHYCYLDAGMAPNIVPDTASVKYFVRAIKRETCSDAFQRVQECARGAAIMTGTTVEMEYLGGIYPTLQNHVLAETFYEARKELDLPTYTEEELKFADEINRTSDQYVEGQTVPIDNAVHEIDNENGYGSTDYADVQHICPGYYFNTATGATLQGGHSWKVTAAGGMSIGMKGMSYAAKIMAVGTMKMIESPEKVEAMKEEFKKAMNGTVYECPVTDEIPDPYAFMRK